MTEEFFNIDSRLALVAKQAEERAKEAFAAVDEIAAYNEAKTLHAFTKCKVSESHFKGSTGYGYGDRGREVLDEVYAEIFGCEDALVRHNFVSGTHALSVALFGVLRTGDRLLCVSGAPYDTMEEVIGIRGSGCGSLKDFGVEYEQLELKNGKLDLEAIEKALKNDSRKTVVYIQRSRGYSMRPSLKLDEIAEGTAVAKKADSDCIVIVDNCYGEFVEKNEPTNFGADLAVGSLIKNAGGGIARTGGYIVGRHDLVELCSYRLTCVGAGKEVGCSLDMSRELFLGTFLAPGVVASAVKTSIFALSLFDLLGFKVTPSYNESRTDIIAAIELKTPKALVAFCEGIQKGSPIDSFVSPEPWDMPGYENEVVMAAGAFTNGASIELSADGPMREPYSVWLQGGITYNSGKIGIMLAAQAMLEKGEITI